MPVTRRQRRKARASPIPPRPAKKPAQKTTSSMRTLNAFQDKPGAQKATGSRSKVKNVRNNLLHVPTVPLSYIIVGASRRGGRLRRLPATSTKKMSTSAQGLCVWCTNRFHRLKPKFYREIYVEDCRTYEDTRKGAQGGCHICSLLSAGITAVRRQNKEKNWLIRTTLIMSVDNREFTVVFRINDKNFQFCSLQGK
jgi:hypothetical protein